MPTRSIPLACPNCGGPVINRPGRAPRCETFGHVIDLEAGPPEPTEADRLRKLVERAMPFALTCAIMGDSAAQAWFDEARAALEGKL